MLSLIAVQGNIVFLRPRSEIVRVTVFFSAAQRDDGEDDSLMCMVMHKRMSPGSFSTLWLEDKIENS